MKRPLLGSAVALAALASTPAFGQDLSAEVVRNPDDTVTYTIDLDGPPNGFWLSVYMLGPSLFPPYTLPGMFGELYFDPLTAILGPSLVLDPQGKGTMQFTFPAATLDDQPIYSQALVVDGLGQLASSNLAMWYHSDQSIGGIQGLRISNGSLTSIIGDVTGAPGTPVRIEHTASDGGLKGQATLAIGPSGQAPIAFGTPPVQYCDTTSVYFDLGFGWQLYRQIPWHLE